MDKNTPIIACIGEILWDILPEGRKLGGAPANCAYHAAKMGCEAYIISSVGNDHDGTEIIDKLRALEMNTDLITVNEKLPTGTVTVKIDKKGNPDYTIHQNVAWDNILPGGNTRKTIMQADALCFGSLAQRSDRSRRVILDLIREAKDDCLKVFDINLRQQYYNKDIIRTSLEQSDILKINEDELIILADMFDIKGAYMQMMSELLESYKLKLIALTRGCRSSILYSKSATSVLSPPKIAVADTVGAGDSFTAALIAGSLKGLDIKEIHRNAIDVSAWVCTHSGAIPEYGKAEEDKFRLFKY